MTTILEKSPKMIRLRRKVLSRRSDRIYSFLSVVAFIILSFTTQPTHAVRSPESYSGRSQPRINKTEFFQDGTILSEETAPDQHEKALSPPRGGARAAASIKRPPIAWAILHNWLYFLSLAFNLLNVPFMIREIVDGPGTKTPSPQSIKLSGNVEAIDKFLTFCGVAFLAALSDQHGRKPLIAWSAFGFAMTNILQVMAGKAPSLGTSKLLLYAADFVDGISSCMTPVCQAYVADCTVGSASLASNLGVFQGISIGGAFVFAFPIGGMLGAKFGPRLPILMAAGFQVVNGLVALFVTPESNARAIENKRSTNRNPESKIDLSEVNPIRGLQNLLGIGSVNGFGTSNQSLLRAASLAYFCLSLARNSLDAQFVNYSNIRFGWSQAQSGPVLVMVGMMMGIVPRILVPLLGLQKCIHYGLLILGVGLSMSGLAPTPMQYIMSFAIISIGFVAVPALQALLANLAPPSQSGALLGAVGSMTELTGAIGSTMYAAVLATFATDATPTSKIASAFTAILPQIQGMHFVVGACFSIIGWAVSSHGLNQNQNHPALVMGVDKSSLSTTAALD